MLQVDIYNGSTRTIVGATATVTLTEPAIQIVKAYDPKSKSILLRDPVSLKTVTVTCDGTPSDDDLRYIGDKAFDRPSESPRDFALTGYVRPESKGMMTCFIGAFPPNASWSYDVKSYRAAQ